MKPITLSTKRLILRRAIDIDSENLFRNYTMDPECSLFLTRRPHAHVNETATFLNKWCDISWEKECNEFAWVISLAENNEAIGVFLVSIDGHKAQIHFGVGRNFWRQGYTTESGYTVVQWLLTQLRLQRIWTVCDLHNYGSIKVLENLGFQNEGILRKWLVLPAFGDSARDCYIFARTSSVIL